MTCTKCGSEQLSNAVVCLNCGTALREIVSTPQQKAIKRFSLIILAVVLISGVGYFFATIGRTYHPVIDHQPTVGYGVQPSAEKIMSSMVSATLEGNEIVVPGEQLTSYRIIRVKDPEGIQTVPVIIYLTPRGKIVTAMSISESCRSNDFYLEGENIHCANCPSYWNMESMEAYACCQKYYPAPIPSTYRNGQIRIEKNVVQEWRTRL